MAAQGFLLVASFLLVLFILARPLGKMLATMRRCRVWPGRKAFCGASSAFPARK